eukprot:gene4838-8423_t
MDQIKHNHAVYDMIHFSANGDLESLKKVVEESSLNLNEGDYDKRTALHLASEEGHIEIVEYLLSKNADVNVTDRWGVTPLRGALNKDNGKIAELLRDKGARTKFEEIKKKKEDEKDESFLENTRILFEKMVSTKEKDKITTDSLKRFLRKRGLDSKRNQVLYEQIQQLSNGSKTIGWESFLKLMRGNNENLLQRALNNDLVIKNWDNFSKEVREIYDIVRKNEKGAPASYIPELGCADPDWCKLFFFLNSKFLVGVSIITTDGQTYDHGDCDLPFSIQSCIKPIVYAMAIEELGYDWIHQYVGKEPSGVAFNAFTLNKQNKPHNSCINAGAIVVSGSYHVELKTAEKFKRVLKNLSDYAGGAKIGFDQAVYLSERETAYNNNALAYFMSSKNGFPPGCSVQDALDFYFQLCSIEVTNKKLATVAATYSNNGICPLTGKKCMSSHTVKRTMQLLFSCGMYDYSGEWACTVGLPAKSGVAGAVFVVVPSICGICIWSPPLNDEGNSVRGVDFAEKLVEKKNWNTFDVIFNKESDHIL